MRKRTRGFEESAESALPHAACPYSAQVRPVRPDGTYTPVGSGRPFGSPPHGVHLYGEDFVCPLPTPVSETYAPPPKRSARNRLLALDWEQLAELPFGPDPAFGRQPINRLDPFRPRPPPAP